MNGIPWDSTPFTLRPAASHNGVGIVQAIRFVAELADSRVDFVDLVQLEAGATVGLHTHTESEQETYIIVSGEGRTFLNGVWSSVAAGSVLPNPPGGTHALENLSTQPLRLIVVQVKIDRDE